MARYREILEKTPAVQQKIGDIYNWVGGAWKYITSSLHPVGPNIVMRHKTCMDELHAGPPFRTGGPLAIRDYTDGRSVSNQGTYDAWTPSGNLGYRYVGGFTCGPLQSYTGFYSDASFRAQTAFGDISSFGAGAWNRYRPGNPAADLGVFLAEMRDLPRMLSTSAKGFHDLWRSMGGSRTSFSPKKVADHWLNTQFGWLPFINDLNKLARASNTVDAMLNQVKRDNGRWVRRGGIVSQVNNRSVVKSDSSRTAHVPLLNSYYYPGGTTGSHRIYLDEVQTVWFSAAFRYYIPDIGSVDWERRCKRAYYGLNISPSLIWELTPWSWLVDWFSNAGDVFANMSNPIAENLAAKYAYIMGETSRVVTCESVHLLSGQAHDASWVHFGKTKSRVSASPFGFGLTSGDLSARQWSILAALGVSFK